MDLRLFPAPTYLPGRLAPHPLPGASPQSTEVLLEVLKENHERWHCFTKQGFHNHAAHNILAKYWLGAKPAILRKALLYDQDTQQANYKSPSDLNDDNLYDYVGVAKYYDAYYKFFSSKLLENGVQATLEDYLLSRKANFISPSKEPQLVGRTLGGLLHPLIHIGYGVEFGIPGITAEGLAQAFVHSTASRNFTPPSLWDQAEHSQGTPPSSDPVHSFTILSRIMKDSRWNRISQTEDTLTGMLKKIVDQHSETIFDYVQSWDMDLSKDGEIERKLEELSFLAVILYAVAGFQNEELFSADFALVHLVTSSVFLPSVVQKLKKSSQEILLRAYLANILAWYIARGRPVANIQRFYSWTELKDSSVNEWNDVLALAIEEPEEHLCKAQRTLAHYASIFGTRAAGQKDFVETELEGAQALDGTLFLRAALLTEQRRKIGKERGGFGDRSSFWGFDGFYHS